jgi:hypothetical protein
LTLIAAFRIAEIPVLMADMLLTTDDQSTKTSFMPHLPHWGDPPADRKIVGVCSKLIILNERLAVAFTGFASAGKLFFADLERRFSQCTPSKDELSKTLTSWNASNVTRGTKVIGWLAHSDHPECFEYIAAPGAAMSWVSSSFGGYGASHFQNSILPSDLSGWGSLTDQELAEFVSTTKANRVVTDDMTTATGLSKHYGYAIEVAQWTGSSFEFHKKVTSIFIEMAFLGDGRLATKPVAIRIYERQNSFALIEHINCYDHAMPDGTKGSGIFVELISPVHLMGQNPAWTPGLLDPVSPIYVFNLHVQNLSNGKSGFAHLTLGPDKVRFTGDRTKFNIEITDQTVIDGVRNAFGAPQSAA